MYCGMKVVGLNDENKEKAKKVFSHRGGFLNYLGEGVILSQYAKNAKTILEKDGCKAYFI